MQVKLKVFDEGDCHQAGFEGGLYPLSHIGVAFKGPFRLA